MKVRFKDHMIKAASDMFYQTREHRMMRFVISSRFDEMRSCRRFTPTPGDDGSNVYNAYNTRETMCVYPTDMIMCHELIVEPDPADPRLLIVKYPYEGSKIFVEHIVPIYDAYGNYSSNTTSYHRLTATAEPLRPQIPHTHTEYEDAKAYWELQHPPPPYEYFDRLEKRLQVIPENNKNELWDKKLDKLFEDEDDKTGK